MSNSIPSGDYPDLPTTAYPPTPSTGGTSGTTGGTVGSTGSTSGSDSGGKADAAKEQASQVGQTAADAGKHVAGTAKDKASEVASEAKTQAKDLYNQTTSELADQAGVQQKRVASGLRSLSDELDTMSTSSENGGVAADLVGQAASRLSGVATWLDDRDPGSLLSEVRQFAARRPGVFIGVAAAAGLLAGRLTRGITEVVKDEKEAEATQSTGTSSAAGGYSTGSSTIAATPPTGAYGSNVPAYDVNSGATTATPLPGESDFR